MFEDRLCPMPLQPPPPDVVPRVLISRVSHLTLSLQALAEQRVRMPDVIAALCLDTATQALELPFHRAQVSHPNPDPTPYLDSHMIYIRLLEPTRTSSPTLAPPCLDTQVLERVSEDAILRGVLLPALSVSSEDQELWAEDEDEYFNRNLIMELEVRSLIRCLFVCLFLPEFVLFVIVGPLVGRSPYLLRLVNHF